MAVASPSLSNDALHVRIALAGNPNSGKTTLFNALTGSHYKVANYPGVTVEKKEGDVVLAPNLKSTLIDIPGIYALFGPAPDEVIATKVLFGSLAASDPLDAVVVVVDASNLERNLYLTSQLIDCGLPMVIALTMSDLAERQGTRVFNELLAKELDVPVVTITSGKGLDALKLALTKLLESRHQSSKRISWLPKESPVRRIARALGTTIKQRGVSPRGYRDVMQAEAAFDEFLLGVSTLSDLVTSSDPEINFAAAKAREELRSLGTDPLTFEATNRYAWARKIAAKVSSLSPTPHHSWAKRFDRFLTHPLSGAIALLGILLFIFQSIFLWAELPMEMISQAVAWLGSLVQKVLPPGILQSLLVDGIIAGVGNVVVFIPQIAILFLFLGILEDTGYLSRAAYLLDRLMRGFGLQGRAFIPLLSSFACAIPGILSTRTIPSRADRIATIMVAPLMSCSARLPVYTVLIGACIPATAVFGPITLQGLTLLGMYLLGIITAAIVSLLLKKTLLRRDPAFLVMELPPFRRPNLKNIGRTVWDKALSFVKNAGTMILACSVVLWVLASFPRAPEDYQGNHVQYSFAGRIGTAMEPLIKPLGYNWEIGVALLGSFAAREVFVSSLATVYHLGDQEDTSVAITDTLRHRSESGLFSLATAISLMVFYVYACMCMSTLAVCQRETGSWKWTTFMFCYMTGLAYVTALIAYQGTVWLSTYG